MKFWRRSQARTAGGSTAALSRWPGAAERSGWTESTFAEQSWERTRTATRRFGIAGAIVGALLALVPAAPASWVASAIASMTGERVLLADARGSLWSGDAVAVLTGGPGSRDASGLPGRLAWSVGWSDGGPHLALRQACCLNGTVLLRLQPGLGRLRVTLVPPAGPVGQWPTAWLVGLGTPWNTMQLGGAIRLASPGLSLEWVQGRWRMDGRAELELDQVSSRLTALDALGSYRVTLAADPSAPGTASVTLTTTEGALQLSGSGTWNANGLRFRGEARTTRPEDPALNNLLNILGRRDGARSVLSIG